MDGVTGTHIKSATESGDLGASVSCDTTALSINPLYGRNPMLVLERHVGESVILRRADTGELIGKVVLLEVRQ